MDFLPTAVVSISANNIGFLQLPFFPIVTADKYRGFLPIKLHLAIFNEILYFAVQSVLAHTSFYYLEMYFKKHIY